jgi:hypothetical protein
LGTVSLDTATIYKPNYMPPKEGKGAKLLSRSPQFSRGWDKYAGDSRVHLPRIEDMHLLDGVRYPTIQPQKSIVYPHK